mgnify:CR=1 FL=1
MQLKDILELIIYIIKELIKLIQIFTDEDVKISDKILVLKFIIDLTCLTAVAYIILKFLPSETKNGDGIEYSISTFGFQTFTYPSISVDAIKRRLKR